MFTKIKNDRLQFIGNHNIKLELYFGDEDFVQEIYTAGADICDFHDIADGLFVGYGDQVMSLRQLCDKAAYEWKGL